MAAAKYRGDAPPGRRVRGRAEECAARSVACVGQRAGSAPRQMRSRVARVQRQAACTRVAGEATCKPGVRCTGSARAARQAAAVSGRRYEGQVGKVSPGVRAVDEREVYNFSPGE